MTSRRKTETDKGSVEHFELDPLKGNGLDKNGDVTAIEFIDSESGNSSADGKRKPKAPLATARDLVTEILAVEDDPTAVSNFGAQVVKHFSLTPIQNPWTFRMWFIGIGISIFAS
jgi:hypothetical protein